MKSDTTFVERITKEREKPNLPEIPEDILEMYSYAVCTAQRNNFRSREEGNEHRTKIKESLRNRFEENPVKAWKEVRDFEIGSRMGNIGNTNVRQSSTISEKEYMENLTRDRGDKTITKEQADLINSEIDKLEGKSR